MVTVVEDFSLVFQPSQWHLKESRSQLFFQHVKIAQNCLA